MTSRAIALLLALSWCCLAATDPVAAILDEARGTPAEIFADVAFHLLDDGRVAEKDRAALLEEIFLRASEVREPLATRPATIAHPATQTTNTVRVGVQKLDALSIRCRVVQKLLAVDAHRARERFAGIPPPDTPKPECKSATIADPTIYFETLAAVVANAPFTKEEQAKQVALWMMEGAVRHIQTSLELIAAARNLPQLVHNPKEATLLAGAFATALAIDDCNRNFSAAAHSVNLVGAVLAASDKLSALGASSRVIPAALRGYLVRHLTTSRCADSIVADYTASVDAYNTAISTRSVVLPISDTETQPAKSEGEAESKMQGDQSSYKQIVDGVGALMGNSNGVRVRMSLSSEIPPLTSEIAVRIREVLAKLREWKGAADQDPIQVFHQKARLYFWIISSLPTGDVYKLAVSGCLATLEDTAILNASPSEWLTELDTFLALRVRGVLHRNNVTETVLSDPDDMISQVMVESTLSAVAVYGRLAQLDRQTQH